MNFSTSPYIKEELYKHHLFEISGVKFTLREMDIISCILHNRGEKKIATLLSISYKTVSAHVHNIMNKLSHSSREYIIDYIEKSGKLQIVRQYYLHLLLQSIFNQKLQTLSKAINNHEYSCSITFNTSCMNTKILAKYLQEYLKLLKVDTDISYAEKEATTNEPYTITILLDSNASTIAVSLCLKENFYLSLLKLLEHIIFKPQLAQIKEEFEQEYLALQDAGNETKLLSTPTKSTISQRIDIVTEHIPAIMRDNNRLAAPYVIIVLGMVTIAALLIYVIITKSTRNSESVEYISQIHSELITPSDLAFLDRDELIKELDTKLYSRKNILRIVAIVGTGGSGKTTLARKYANNKKVELAWEFNAETTESIDQSFSALARTMAKTPEDKSKLKSIDDIRSTTERQNEIINFVKNKLASTPNWILIYDNVDKMGDLIKYFPIGTDILESGKIIITTRDSNIDNNHHIDDVIHIGELNKEQKHQLFIKMLKTNGNSHTEVKTEIVDHFLDAIPPFPLDVTIAAKYIASTHVSFDKYLEHLENNPNAFNDTQQAILQDEGDYKNTRYSIISLSLQQLTANKDFADLLLLMCLLDSQNIPRDILDKYKDAAVVDNLLYHLKKYSIITGESSSAMGQTFSIHRSTQSFTMSYLVQKLNLMNHPELLKPFIQFLGSYIDDTLEQESLEQIHFLLTHCQALLSGNKKFLTDAMRGSIEGKLGNIYYYLSYNTEAAKILESSIEKLNTNYDSYYKEIVQNMIFLSLSKMYTVADDDQSAEATLKASLVIAHKHLQDNDSKIAEILVHLGRIEVKRNNFQKAEEFFQNGLKIYRQNDKKYNVRIAWTLRCLGSMYRASGDHQNAKKYITDSIERYRRSGTKQMAKIYTSYVYLGNIYRDLGDYKKSIELLEEAVAFSNEHYGERRPWALVYLGVAYERNGDYVKAKELLETSLTLYNKSFASNHSKVIWSSMRLGHLYGKLGYYDKAINILQKTLEIELAQSRNLTYTSRILAYLGWIYTDLGQYEKAKELLEQAFAICYKHLPKDHIKNAYLLSLLGKNEALLGRFEEAESILQKSLEMHEKHYGKDNIETARVLINIAQNYIIHGDLAQADVLLNRSKVIFEKAKHPDLYVVLEMFADLHIKKSDVEKSIHHNAETKRLQQLSIIELEQALDIITSNFPEPSNSGHAIRIKSKIDDILKQHSML